MVYLRSSAALMMAILVLINLGLSGCGGDRGPAARKEAPAAEKGVDATAEKAGTAAPLAGSEGVPPTPSMAPITEERTFYDFEGDLQGWEVPQWALGKTDHVAKEVSISQDVASRGKSSMKVDADFYGGAWTAGLVEIQQYLDLSNYRVIRADLYIPPDAPIGLKGKLILTVGDNWKFVEMNGSVPLMPGEWVTVTASIEPGSYDWKRVVPDEEFAKDVRKIAVRVESNNKPKYTGVYYVDNVRVGR